MLHFSSGRENGIALKHIVVDILPPHENSVIISESKALKESRVKSLVFRMGRDFFGVS